MWGTRDLLQEPENREEGELGLPDLGRNLHGRLGLGMTQEKEFDFI